MPGVLLAQHTHSGHAGNMRILYISNRLNARDGSSVHGREFVKALSVLGHDVVPFPEIIIPLPSGRCSVNSSSASDNLSRFQKLRRKLKLNLKSKNRYLRDLINLYEGYFGSKNQIRQIHLLLKQSPPDLIVYRAMLFDFVPNDLYKWNVPMIAEVNSIKNIEMDMGKIKNSTFLSIWAEDHNLKPAKAVTVVSEPIKKHLEECALDKPIEVVENGVDLEEFKPNAKTKQRLQQKYGTSGKVVVGYIGSYKRWHGLTDTLKVARTLVDDQLPVHFILIGSGDDAALIQKSIVDLSLQDHVTQIPNLPHKEIAEHINLIDIALMTYPDMKFFYFSPLKMYEYLAAGIPVVSSRLGQIESTLDGRSFGRLVDPGDIRGFAEALIPLISDTQHRRSISQDARIWAEQYCSWTSNVSKVVSLGKSLGSR